MRWDVQLLNSICPSTLTCFRYSREYVRVKVDKIRSLFRRVANYKVHNSMYHGVPNYTICVRRIIYVVVEIRVLPTLYISIKREIIQKWFI